MSNNAIADRLRQLKQKDELQKMEQVAIHQAKVALAELLVTEAKGSKEFLPDVEMILGTVTEDGPGSQVEFEISIAKKGDDVVGEPRQLTGYLTADLGGRISHSYSSGDRIVEPGGWIDAVANGLWYLAEQPDLPSEW